ncbi:MAG: hypothetical protein HYV04_22630 [Deltaproteobacteria bacterium]|nr:hypothetical protein [Deltaproteobacteria bacterium]
MRLVKLPGVVLMGILLASCSLGQMGGASKVEQSILGRWREINGPTTLEFFSHGTVIIATDQKATSAYYEFVDEQSVKIEPKFRSREMKNDSRVWRVAIRGDQLTVVDAGKAMRFQRQR